MSTIKYNRQGWNKLVQHIINTEGVRRMRQVAQACNAAANTDQYMVSVEGSNPLRKRNFRATVITAGPKAARDNAENNTLLANFHLAGR